MDEIRTVHFLHADEFWTVRLCLPVDLFDTIVEGS